MAIADAGDNAADARVMPRMIVRRPPFSFSQQRALFWNKKRPEFSQIVNAASLAMPYLEPYLIKTMRQARPLISNPDLVRDLDLYCAQESAHYRQHRRFNDELKAILPETVSALEKRLDEDYAWLGANRSLRFNLAYAEGFESMALAIGHLLIKDRDFLFGGSNTEVASLVLWHFAEEIEHKAVTYDVFEHVSGSAFWRFVGLFYATGHIFWRTRAGYQAFLKAEGLWTNWRSRLALARVLIRVMRILAGRFVLIFIPGYHPNKIADPEWMTKWVALHQADDQATARLDTNRLKEAVPVALAG